MANRAAADPYRLIPTLSAHFRRDWTKVQYRYSRRPVHTHRPRMGCRAWMLGALPREAVHAVRELGKDAAQPGMETEGAPPPMAKPERILTQAYRAFQLLAPHLSFLDSCYLLSAACPANCAGSQCDNSVGRYSESLSCAGVCRPRVSLGD